MLPRFFRFFPTRSGPIVFRASDFRRICNFQQFRCFAAMAMFRCCTEAWLFFHHFSRHPFISNQWLRHYLRMFTEKRSKRALQTGAPVSPSLSPAFSVCAVWCKTSWQAPWMGWHRMCVCMNAAQNGAEAKHDWCTVYGTVIVCIFWRDSYKFQAMRNVYNL